VRSKPVTAPPAAEGFVTQEAEVKAELAEAQPFNPATGVAEPLDEAGAR
jgi:hypothetical protein